MNIGLGLGLELGLGLGLAGTSFFLTLTLTLYIQCACADMQWCEGSPQYYITFQWFIYPSIFGILKEKV